MNDANLSYMNPTGQILKIWGKKSSGYEEKPKKGENEKGDQVKELDVLLLKLSSQTLKRKLF